MPYVDPQDALNAPQIDLAQIEREMGPMPWRKPLVGLPAVRWVLIGWPAGFVAQTHFHPRAAEVFHVLRGRAVFRFGADGPRRAVEAGTMLFAPPGMQHTISVPGPEPLVMLASLSPNEDASDETIDVR